MAKKKRGATTLRIALATLVLLPLLLSVLGFTFYQPDRARQSIAPGSSTKPTFEVQIIRPRMGLPLGGMLPPGWFGVDAELQFNSKSPRAEVQECRSGRIELSAEAWQLVLDFDESGKIVDGTYIVFPMIFEDRARLVRGRPAAAPVGTLQVSRIVGTEKVAGQFRLELVYCEDFESGEALGWPPQPLVLRGSFDQLMMAKGNH